VAAVAIEALSKKCDYLRIAGSYRKAALDVNG